MAVTMGGGPSLMYGSKALAIWDELAAAADAERVAKLRGMPDVDAVQSAIAWASETVDLDAIPGRMLQGLKDAGFERRER